MNEVRIDTYYLLRTRAEDGWLSMTREAVEVAKKDWFCTGCVLPRRGTARPLDLTLRKPPPFKPMDIVTPCGVHVGYVPFLEEIGWDISERCFYIGKVYVGSEQRLVPDWVSLWGKHRVIPRGVRNARPPRVCEKCGRYLYFASDLEFLYPPPREDVEIFDSTRGWVFRPDVFERVRRSNWVRKFYIIELTVVTEDPPDGLGVIPAE